MLLNSCFLSWNVWWCVGCISCELMDWGKAFSCCSFFTTIWVLEGDLWYLEFCYWERGFWCDGTCLSSCLCAGVGSLSLYRAQQWYLPPSQDRTIWQVANPNAQRWRHCFVDDTVLCEELGLVNGCYNLSSRGAVPKCFNGHDLVSLYNHFIQLLWTDKYKPPSFGWSNLAQWYTKLQFVTLSLPSIEVLCEGLRYRNYWAARLTVSILPASNITILPYMRPESWARPNK